MSEIAYKIRAPEKCSKLGQKKKNAISCEQNQKTNTRMMKYYFFKKKKKTLVSIRGPCANFPVWRAVLSIFLTLFLGNT